MISWTSATGSSLGMLGDVFFDGTGGERCAFIYAWTSSERGTVWYSTSVICFSRVGLPLFDFGRTLVRTLALFCRCHVSERFAAA